MSHPPHQSSGAQRRAGLLAVLFLSLAAPPALAGTWVQLKTNVGVLEMLFYTDAPAQGGGVDTIIFNNVQSLPLQQRSGRVRRALPMLESLLLDDPTGMIFHRADDNHVYTGVIKLLDSGEFEVINQDVKERYPFLRLEDGSKRGFLPRPALRRGDIVLAYTNVSDRKRVVNGNKVDDPVRGQGFRFAITTVEGMTLDPCAERFDPRAKVERIDGQPLDEIFAPDEYDCAIAIVGHVVKGMDVIDTIASSPQIHGFFGIDSDPLGGLSSPLVHELARFPLLSPITQPRPNDDGTSIFGCASVFAPFPGPPGEPRVNASNCTSSAERVAWIRNRREIFGPEIADNLIRVRRTKFRPSLRGNESIEFRGGVRTQVGRILDVVHPAEWILRIDGDQWSATDHMGFDYSGTVNPLGDDKFRLRPDAETEVTLVARWTAEVEQQAFTMMTLLAQVDGQRALESQVFPLLDHSNPSPEAAASLQLNSKPKLIASINPDNGIVDLQVRGNLVGDLLSIARKFDLSEPGAKLVGRTGPVNVEFVMNVRGFQTSGPN